MERDAQGHVSAESQASDHNGDDDRDCRLLDRLPAMCQILG